MSAEEYGEFILEMPTRNTVEPHFDSLMEILFAQYSDLEALLGLARREEAAACEKDFDRILEVVTERATLGERLAVYHRQLAELRARLGNDIEPALGNSVVGRTQALVEAIKMQDALTQPKLIAARDEALKQSLRIDQARRNLGAYAQNRQPLSIACDERV